MVAPPPPDSGDRCCNLGQHFPKILCLQSGSDQEEPSSISLFHELLSCVWLFSDSVAVQSNNVSAMNEALNDISGIPVTCLGRDEKEKLIGLSERLRQRVVGQDEAVKTIAEAVIRSRVGLGLPEKPIFRG